jgi:hypothetical protein
LKKQAVKDVLYGGLLELMRDERFFYYSTVNHSYSHWTEEGQQALLEYMQANSQLMLICDETELDERARRLVISGLKAN